MSGLVAVLLVAAPNAGASPARTAKAVATCSSDVSPTYRVNGLQVDTLAGNVHSGDLVSVEFVAKLASVGVPCMWSLTSYQTQSATFVLAGQTRFQYGEKSGVGPHRLQVRVPSCYFQVDFANGPSIEFLKDTMLYGPLLIAHENSGVTACVTVTPVTPVCSPVAGAAITSDFTFTNPTTGSITVAVTRTLQGPPRTNTTLPALTVPPGTTTFSLPAVEDATQRFTFVGTGVNVSVPWATVDCLKPSASVQAVCNSSTGLASATLSVVNPDALAEKVQVSTNGGLAVDLVVGANSVPAMTPALDFDPAKSAPTYVVTDASETPVFSQTVTLTGFSCVVPT